MAKRITRVGSIESDSEVSQTMADVFEKIEHLKRAHKKSSFYENFMENRKSENFSYIWISRVAALKHLARSAGDAMQEISDSKAFTKNEKEFLLYNVNRLEEISKMTLVEFEAEAAGYFSNE